MRFRLLPRLDPLERLTLGLAVCGAWFGFANPVAHLPLASLLFPAGLLVLGRLASTPKRAFRLGLLAGTLAFAGCLYWVALPVHDYGALPWILAAPCPVLVSLYCALYAGLFSLGARLVRDRLPLLAQGLLAGAAWSLLETVRGTFLTGFPWLVLPSAFGPWPLALQTAALVGGEGLSALLAAAACLLALSAAPHTLDPTRKAPRLACALAGVLVLASLAIYGRMRLSDNVEYPGQVPVTIVQGNIDQGQKWDPALQQYTVDHYLKLSLRSLESDKSALLVWPETAMPLYFQEDSKFSHAVRAFAASRGVPILTGAPGYVRKKDARTYDLFNRAYLIDGLGGLSGFYDKEHLVPFGEYVPLGDYLPFLSKLAQGAGDFAPGLALAPLHSAGLAMGMLICYESIFPDLVRKRVADGANILVNISNDAWFGKSSAPMQHLHLSLVRAVEQKRFLIRSTNTGISAFVDPMGRILARSALFEDRVMTHAVAPLTETTVYHRIAWFMPWAFTAILALGALWAFCRPGARRNDQPAQAG